jgi:hypothetical protein
VSAPTGPDTANESADAAVTRAVSAVNKKRRLAAIGALRQAQIEIGTLEEVLRAQDTSGGLLEMAHGWKTAVVEARRLLSEEL